MYTLYYSPGACSLAIHALLRDLGVPFELSRVSLDKQENHSPEYMKLNPRGQVPVLVDGDKVLRESGAIAITLSDRHHGRLLPESGWERAQALEWLLFYNSTLHQAHAAYFLMRRSLKDESTKAAACELAMKRIAHLWREVDAHLEQNRYLCGNRLTLADLFHTVIANWSTVLKPRLDPGPHDRRLCQEVIQIPCFAEALKAEHMTYALVKS